MYVSGEMSWVSILSWTHWHLLSTLTENDVSRENKDTGEGNGKLESFGEWEKDLHKSY